MRIWILAVLVSFFSGCAIYQYPGQPGMKTNDYSKLDQDSLDEVGLWLTNVYYDNSEGGKGVKAIVTYLHPAAQTYTSNVRTNADGTLYRFKKNADGALVQAISLPQQGTVIFPDDSMVLLLIGYDTSMDEVDDANLAEQKVFTGFKRVVKKSQKAIQFLKTRYEWLKAGTFSNDGQLNYEVESVTLEDKVLQFGSPVKITTNVLGTSNHKSIDLNTRKQIIDFVETNFPRGFSGAVKIQVKGEAQAFEVPLKIQTPKTLQNGGTIVKHMTQDEAQIFVKTLSQTKSKAN